MKRLFLSFCCIISIFWFLPLFVKASVVGPDMNTYDYVYSTYDNAINIYSNYKICGCSQYTWVRDGETRYQVIGIADKNGTTYCGTLQSLSGQAETQLVSKYPNANTQFYNSNYIAYKSNNQYPDGNSNLYVTTTSYSGLQIFQTIEECYTYLTTPDIDFESIYYDPTVPTPNFNVYMIRPDAWENITEETNFFNISWSEYSSYYIQIGYKYSVPNSMKVGVTDGNKVYTPLSYFDSSYYDIYSLEDLHSAISLNATVNSSNFVWQSYSIDDPESWQATVPPWVHNYNNSAYVSARNNWNNKLALCMPLYGNKLEIFARLFYVEDGVVYVGAWRHWNNSYPSEYGEELPQNYQVENAIPGYQNTSNNTEYQEQTYTITSIGEETGKSIGTTIINNLTPNYPDYPTAVTYNHDNILLQMIDTTKRLPSFFGDFTDFCKECMTVIPSEIWEIIAFGFLCSILVMIVKVL